MSLEYNVKNPGRQRVVQVTEPSVATIFDYGNAIEARQRSYELLKVSGRNTKSYNDIRPWDGTQSS